MKNVSIESFTYKGKITFMTFEEGDSDPSFVSRSYTLGEVCDIISDFKKTIIESAGEFNIEEIIKFSDTFNKISKDVINSIKRDAISSTTFRVGEVYGKYNSTKTYVVVKVSGNNLSLRVQGAPHVFTIPLSRASNFYLMNEVI